VLPGDGEIDVRCLLTPFDKYRAVGWGFESS
jgi:hypothetical protein